MPAVSEPAAVRRGGVGEAAPRLLTLPEVAAFLRVSPKTVRRLVAGRKIRCVRVGRVLRFRQADLFRFVEAVEE
ncbi:MAG: helix-turn-helix domain-containing protein [Candidatus Eisenbacteria bacterium]|nr:helix-turn-helix domain-containing protein [Candidatus Eisenbacteria bacterium]